MANVLNAEKAQAIVAALRDGGAIPDIAKRFNVARLTVYRYGWNNKILAVPGRREHTPRPKKQKPEPDAFELKRLEFGRQARNLRWNASKNGMAF